MTTYNPVFKSAEGQARYEAAYDRTLAHWPVPCESITMRTSAGTTHLIASGDTDKPPLMLVHMYSMSATMWFPNVEALSKNYRVYALDVIGDLGKGTPTAPSRSHKASARWMLDILDGLHIEQINLVGASYGGWLSVNLTANAPQRIRRLALIAPAGVFKPLRMRFWMAMLPAVLSPTLESVRTAVNNLAGYRFEADPAIIEQMLAGLEHRNMATFFGLPYPTALPDRVLRFLAIPVLLLLGEKETIYDVNQVMTRARRLIPSLEGHIIPGVGHGLSMENPAVVNEYLLTFFA